MAVRDAAKGARLEAAFGVPTVRTLDDLLRPAGMEFVVVSAPWAVSPVLLRELAERGVPALAETPPAPDLPGLVALYDFAAGRGARIQVAEQYQFQPLHAARLTIARNGELGVVSQAQVSVAHGYHGISLLRGFLGVGFEEATIRARRFVTPIVQSPGRDGPPDAERIVDSEQLIAELDFGDRFGIFDFTGDQYFSYVRSPRLLVRGERGEIKDEEIRYLADHATGVQCSLRRVNAGEAGNLEGYHLKGYLMGERWIYCNPFAPGRLSDDEIAVATCLEKMAQHAAGGPSFYSLAQAAQDHYLSLLMNESARSGQAVRAERQPWAAAPAA
jgi:predicted dehydrogenase